MKTLGNPWMGQNRSRSGGARAHTGANGRRSRAPPPGQRSGPPAPQVWAFMPPWLDSSGLLTRLPTLGSQQRLRGSLKGRAALFTKSCVPATVCKGHKLAPGARGQHPGAHPLPRSSALIRVPCLVLTANPLRRLGQTPAQGS